MTEHELDPPQIQKVLWKAPTRECESSPHARPRAVPLPSR
jgi:hypothetical protein